MEHSHRGYAPLCSFLPPSKLPYTQPLFTTNASLSKKSEDLFCHFLCFYYFFIFFIEKSVDCKKAFCMMSEKWNSPKFQQRAEANDAHSVLYICTKRWTNRIPTTYCKMAWEYCFFHVHFVRAFGDASFPWTQGNKSHAFFVSVNQQTRKYNRWIRRLTGKQMFYYNEKDIETGSLRLNVGGSN